MRETVVKLQAIKAARALQKPAVPAPVPKAATVLAEAITARVVRRGWPLGLRLGTESELIARYKVSRSTLREAVRELERHGVARMVRGAGLVVSEPARTTAVRALTSYIQFSGISRDEIADMRALLGIHAVGLATSRLDDAGIVRLRALENAFRTARDDIERQHLYHSIRHCIADLSGNPLITVLLDALEPFVSDSLEAGELHGESNGLSVLEAIISGDRGCAEELTRARLDRYRERSRSPVGGSLGFSQHAVSTGFRTTKLGEAISEEIARQVASAGWARDSRIGTEEELRQRFGVSHAIIRESLSLLERHGIVFRQRGRTGGLLVRPPDPGYTVKVVTGFLRFLRLDTENFLDMRRLLEPEAAARAAERVTPEALQDLRDTLDRILEPGDNEAGRTFLVQVADASGNRVLSLFVQTLMGTFYTVPADELPQPFRRGVHKTLRGIFEAIVAHDVPLVRRRSIQHLEFAARCMQEGLVTI